MTLPAKPLDLSSRPLVHAYLAGYPPEISEHTFTNLFSWRHHRPIFILEWEKTLVFLLHAASGADQFIMFGPPVGPAPLPEIADHLGSALAGAIRLPSELSAEAEKAGLTPRPDRDNADYVYRVKDLAELSGRKYAKKRNKIKQCLAAFTCEYEPMTAERIPECMAMQEAWCRERKCEHHPSLCSEYKALEETFANFSELEVIGGIIRVEGKISAFAVAERLSPHTAVWHFEKALSGFPGLGQLVNHWFSRYGLTDFAFVNREQDLGVPGLRQAKESYYPHHLVEKITTIDPGSAHAPGTDRDLCP